ncbi:putative secreted protein with PEP-CTERM sorting signal [Pseudoduganella lurida]|uniref:Putative secreted protein with PEP-CTERM sorting signal n=1 Tax=Pseudoduganella lurida TaxID=1036180 RepID=A0A562R1S6_9BURK|nr:EDSAP-1 family PEP-CTERM protein [Pseudoduganella lurida]TWI62997.1 putative secreted protein with PEP-CTERM sorting signal [Pseudoduganella lurida]
MKIKTLLAALALGAASAAPAFAGVAGMADLNISQLLAVDPITHQPSPFTSQIQIRTDSRTGTANSNFNGIVGTGTGAGSITDTRTDGTTASVDVAYRCAGSSCAGINAIYGGTAENNLGTHLHTNSGNFALGDMYNSGNILAGGASGLTRADSSIDNAGGGGANATILNGAGVVTTFAAGSTVDFQLALTYNAFVAAFVDPLLATGNQASSAISWSLTLRNTTTGTTVLAWTPDALNKGFTSTTGSENASFEESAQIFSNTFTLLAGNTYSLVINQAANSTVTLAAVPEPESLLLVGLGLLAMGVAVRRTRG